LKRRAWETGPRSIVATFTRYFIQGILNVCILFVPEVIVLSGGVMRSADLFMPTVEACLTGLHRDGACPSGAHPACKTWLLRRIIRRSLYHLVKGSMKPFHEVPYVQDILSQPDSLKSALAKFDASPLGALKDALQRGDFDRILLTGMGASLHAAYPAWLALVQAGLPAMWVDTAELIHHAPELVTPRTLYWLFSQSGRSAEIVSALDFDRLPRPGPCSPPSTISRVPWQKQHMNSTPFSLCADQRNWSKRRFPPARTSTLWQ
jgi:hypothetical protein